MNTKIIGNINTTACIVFLLGGIGLLTVIALDKLYWSPGTSILTEGWPNFSTGYMVRSTIIFISMLAAFWGLTGSSRPELRLDERGGVSFEQLSMLSALFISAVILLLFILNPSMFSTLSMEDGIIEWGSALLLFASCIIAAISFVKSRNVPNIPKGVQLTFALFSFVFFVIAMEEVSWFQRVLEVETPEAFGNNYQKEMNFHNFYTNYSENLYYLGAFSFLVALPFFRLIFPFVSNIDYLRIFVPRPYIAVIGSVACAYNFDMWNIIFTQIAFFGSVLILIAFFVFSSNRTDKHIISFTIVLITATQVLFLNNGDNFARNWEVTEYKEFFIPLALFIYSLGVLTHIKQLQYPEKNDQAYAHG